MNIFISKETDTSAKSESKKPRMYVIVKGRSITTIYHPN